MAITVQVKPDFSAFVTPDENEIAAVITQYVYGDNGPYTDTDDRSACTRAAAALLEKFVILPR